MTKNCCLKPKSNTKNYTDKFFCFANPLTEQDSATNLEDFKTAVKETQAFQKRIKELKTKLNNTTTDITDLCRRASKPEDIFNQLKPKSTEDIVDELKTLILKLDECRQYSVELLQKGISACQQLEIIENQQCYCALNSESCELLKKQLNDIATEKKCIDDKLNELKCKGKECAKSDIIKSVKKELEDIKTCTLWYCPPPEDKLKPSFRTAGVQKYSSPGKPEILQTEPDRKWTQGTRPPHQSCCSIGMNTIVSHRF